MFGPRLASGIVLIIIALATMSFGGWALAGILLAISLVGYRELTKALRAANSICWNMQALQELFFIM